MPIVYKCLLFDTTYFCSYTAMEKLQYPKSKINEKIQRHIKGFQFVTFLRQKPGLLSKRNCSKIFPAINVNVWHLTWTKYRRQIHKIKKNKVFFGMFYSRFWEVFYHSGLVIDSKPFRVFLKFPNLSLKAFDNSWGNSYIHLLTITI